VLQHRCEVSDLGLGGEGLAPFELRAPSISSMVKETTIDSTCCEIFGEAVARQRQVEVNFRGKGVSMNEENPMVWLGHCGTNLSEVNLLVIDGQKRLIALDWTVLALLLRFRL
jgi:hypothetical protein